MTTWRNFLKLVMDRRPTKAYVNKGRVLFYRAYLFTLFGWVWYLHHYQRSDPDERGHHDHPMRAWAFMLAGGYREERVAGFDRNGPVYRSHPRRPGRGYYLPENVFHRVVIDRPGATSWSLFVSRYVPGKGWGFLSRVQRRVGMPLIDGTATMRYVEAGGGIDSENPWWHTRPNGKEVRSAAIAAGTEKEGRPA